METDWREILKFSQKELKKAEKEKLCESLAWMEADDIDLNFSDLKTLFRLAQDIIKYKNEQVNNLLGKLDKYKRKVKTKERSTITDSPAVSSDSVFDTIASQEEVIKANKDVLEQLYADIAELEEKKTKYQAERNKDESDSSRGTLSELNAVAQLENDVLRRNRHIKKLLGDVKILEEENSTLKEKLTIFKEKLKEATVLIENLTEQLFMFNSEHCKLKELLARLEEEKIKFAVETEALKNDLTKNNLRKEKVEKDVTAKLQQYKALLKSHKKEIDQLSKENNQLKEDLKQKAELNVSPSSVSAEVPTYIAIGGRDAGAAKWTHGEHLPWLTPTLNIRIQKNTVKEYKYSNDDKNVKELQDKLIEASEEITKSAYVIETLKEENKRLQSIIEDIPENSTSEHKNESDDGKEQILISKFKKKIKSLNIALHGAEEMIATREKEFTEISAQLNLLSSEEGIQALLESIKKKKRHLKIKDEGIKSLVQEVNSLNHVVDQLQLENATMRERLQIPVTEKVMTNGILKKYKDLETTNTELSKKLQEYENRIITMEIDYCDKNLQLQKLTSNGDKSNISNGQNNENMCSTNDTSIIEENEALRNGLNEILTFIKENDNTAPGILSIKCPSLEAILNSMEARKLSGWYSPHMRTVLELKAAIGGNDALMSALHESRKETFKVMKKLDEEEKRSYDLEKTVLDAKEKLKLKKDTLDKTSSTADMNIGEFGSWISDEYYKNIDFTIGKHIQNTLIKGNIVFENHFIKAIQYFKDKFTIIYDKLHALTITSEDNLSKWVIKEENYKADIENLKSQLDENDTCSNASPGLVTTFQSNTMERKYQFLEDSFKQIRTLSENLRNEYLESKRDKMLEIFEYEKKVQTLITSVLELSYKLRNSVPMDIFLKQNALLNETILKHRNAIELHNKIYFQEVDLLKKLDNDKRDIINTIKGINGNEQSKVLPDVERVIFEKQLEQINVELNNKNREIKILEQKLIDLQASQSQLLDSGLCMRNDEEKNDNNDKIQSLEQQNQFLKDQGKDIQNKYELLLLQLKGYEQQKLSNDIETNMLRHQILDLQSTGDGKAIIARLSGEVLLAQLQRSECYEKIEALKVALQREKYLRAETEEILINRQAVFDVYSKKFQKQFRYINDVIDILRHQYAGSLPLISIELFCSRLEELQCQSRATEEKLAEIEELRSDLMTKHSVYTHILDLAKTKCFVEDGVCPHKVKIAIMEKTNAMESENYSKRLLSIDESNKKLLKRCDDLERTIVFINHGFKASNINQESSIVKKELENIDVEDIQSHDEASNKGSLTYILPNDELENPPLKNNKPTHQQSPIISPVPTVVENRKLENRLTQTPLKHSLAKLIQTDDDKGMELNSQLNKCLSDNREKDTMINKLNLITSTKEQELQLLNKKTNELSNKIQVLLNRIAEKDEKSQNLEAIIETLEKEINSIRMNQLNQATDKVNVENQTLLENIKKIENDKNNIINEYKTLLKNERDEYLKSIKNLQLKITDLQTKVDERQSKAIVPNDDAIKKDISKYTLKITDLENKCFKLQSNLEGYKADQNNQLSELERWKELASERLSKMEQLSAQLKERHSHEMESYKAENQHWLSQLNETQKEHMELRSRLTEQKAFHLKQLAEKDAHIEQLRSVVNNLKTQILNMQTMLTINDPSFDLSAIVEVDEVSDAASQQGSDRLELKFESTVDLNDLQDDFMRMPSSTTAIWQEPLIERLRREKQLVGKQNAILRRQIKVLAARERRSRLDAQNLKNQVFRISTNGSKVPSAESAALQNKIASLQAQLTSARRDAHSTVALWDKWKRAQQASERWQGKYEDKCQEMKKIEISLNLAKSAVARLEKEKRVLLSRLDTFKNDKSLAIEKHDEEVSEKALTRSDICLSPPPVSTRSLLDRIEAQQRRIAALELAEKGNETIVSEYEKSLAEITSLKGQVLKLESTLLEVQIRSPFKLTTDGKPEVDYWKNYCDMLKEENMQLTLRVNSVENLPTSTNQQRVNDLEQTVLTLRGLVSKLQSEQKSSVGVQRRVDSRPSSGRSGTEKINRSQLESYRIEISNLKKSILEKDALLESSKEMLKIAAEREDDLLRENTMLQRRIEQLTESKRGFMSA